jgi:hypothetical protein
MNVSSTPDNRETDQDQPSSGPAGRPAGTVDEDANPPLTDPESAQVPDSPGNIPPQDTGRAVPPYDGRQTSAKPGGGREGDIARSPAPESTPGGSTASPADEQPAAEQAETRGDDEGVGPSHTPGTRRGEDKL